MRKFNIILAILLLLPLSVYAAAPSRTYNYVAHTTIDPTENNTNENNLYAYLQAGVDTYASGSITNDAISSIAAISYSKLNLLNGITNADVNSSAGITYSKLNLTGGILNADVNSSAAIAYSKLNLTGGIVNADVNASAAIADTKLATISTAGKVSGASFTSLSSIPGGAGVIPAANLPAGTFSLVSATTISGASTTGSISLTSGNTYFIVFNLFNCSGADILQLRFNGDSGSNYKYATIGSTTSASWSLLSASDTEIQLGRAVLSSATSGWNGSFNLMQVGTSSQKYRIWGDLSYEENTASLFSMANFSGQWSNAANITSFELFTQGASTMSGTVYLYKVSTT